MKKKISIIMALVLMLSTILSINVFAASDTFIATAQINVYRDSNCKTRGTSNPAKSYNAYISKGDKVYVYQLSSTSAKINYPTSSGRKTGYIKRNDYNKLNRQAKQVKISGYCYDFAGRNAMQKRSTAKLYSKNNKLLGTVKGSSGWFTMNCTVNYPDSPSYIIFDTEVGGYKAGGIYKLTGTDIQNIKNSKEISVKALVSIGWKFDGNANHYVNK